MVESKDVLKNCSFSGGRTDMSKLLITNKDAIALVIDRLTQRHEDCRKGQIVLLLAEFRKYMPPCWDSYFNTNVAYGHVGKSKMSTFNFRGAYLMTNEKVRTYWYRTRRGHYALTQLGAQRVVELKRQYEDVRNSFGV